MISKERFKEKVEMIRLKHSDFNYEVSILHNTNTNYIVSGVKVNGKWLYRVCNSKYSLTCNNYKTVKEVMELFDGLLKNSRWNGFFI